jgi:hypothetical protein
MAMNLMRPWLVRVRQPDYYDAERYPDHADRVALRQMWLVWMSQRWERDPNGRNAWLQHDQIVLFQRLYPMDLMFVEPLSRNEIIAFFQNNQNIAVGQGDYRIEDDWWNVHFAMRRMAQN